MQIQFKFLREIFNNILNTSDCLDYSYLKHYKHLSPCKMPHKLFIWILDCTLAVHFSTGEVQGQCVA